MTKINTQEKRTDCLKSSSKLTATCLSSSLRCHIPTVKLKFSGTTVSKFLYLNVKSRPLVRGWTATWPSVLELSGLPSFTFRFFFCVIVPIAVWLQCVTTWGPKTIQLQDKTCNKSSTCKKAVIWNMPEGSRSLRKYNFVWGRRRFSAYVDVFCFFPCQCSPNYFPYCSLLNTHFH